MANYAVTSFLNLQARYVILFGNHVSESARAIPVGADHRGNIPILRTMVKYIACLIAIGFLFIQSVAAESTASVKKPRTPIPLQAEGIPNFFQLSERIYSGAAPEGDAGFAALRKLGIKTLISVDGTKPDVEMAHKYGMHYVHLPHGYDGIPKKTQALLIKAAETEPAPIFIHCHHGMHRGPAGAAIVCMGTAGWTPAQGLEWLKLARTSTNYVGLFKTVRDFKAPSEEELKKLPSDFPEIAKTSGLIDTMVSVDGQWDHLKEIRKAGYQAPKEHPDLDPADEALILSEHFREAQRLPDAGHRGNAFLEKLKVAEGKAKECEQLLRLFQKEQPPEARAQLDKTFDAMTKTCAACHKQYRDPAGIKSR